MGVAPYYRGTDCNFWALFDNNPHLVGATIYKLSEGLDTGQILYHALSEIKDDPFIYTMSVVKSAFDSLVEKIIYRYEHIGESDAVAKRGYQFALDHFDANKKGQFLTDILKDL